MSRRINILQPLAIYSAHEENSKTSDFLHEGEIVEFNREKRRNGINWMEIYIAGKALYIKKDFSKMYIVRDARLSDDSCTVVFIEENDGRKRSFSEVFSASRIENEENNTAVKLSRTYDSGKKEKYLELFYDKNNADVSIKTLVKKDKFDITSENKVFLEILYGKRTGYILSNVDYSESKDWWMKPLMYIIMIAVAILAFAVIFKTGWIVIGPILLIPGAILAFVIMLVVKITLGILNFFFQRIRKRF